MCRLPQIAAIVKEENQKRDNMSDFAREIWIAFLNNHFKVNTKPTMKKVTAEQVARLFFDMKVELRANRKVTRRSRTGRRILNKALEKATVSGDFHPFIAMPSSGQDELALRTQSILLVLSDPSRASETITTVPKHAPENIQQMSVLLYTLALFESSIPDELPSVLSSDQNGVSIEDKGKAQKLGYAAGQGFANLLLKVMGLGKS